MTPERWRTVEQIFHAASELAGSEQASYLDRVCAGDAELRQELQTLLAADQTAPVDIGLAIEQEAQKLLEDESEAAWVGRSLGPWRITSLVGVVERAEGVPKDLKPENGLVTPNGMVKLLDFGVV